jgi:hypothetical protein
LVLVIARPDDEHQNLSLRMTFLETGYAEA